MLLLRHPSSSGPMSRALGSYVLDPDTQVVAPVLNLLSEVDEQPASDLVLRLLQTERLPLRRAAASVAADKLRRGHFAVSSLTVLEEHARQRLRHEDPLEGGLDALDLATQLPGASFTRLLDAIGDRRVRAQVQRAQETGELIARSQAARVVADATAAIQADASGDAAEPDPMLRRLVREALLHTHKPRRHHAAVLLAASPYRHAVSRVCHDLTGGNNYFLAARAWTVLMRVGHAGRRADIALRALSDGRTALRGRALVNLGLNPEPISPGEARAVISGLQAEPDQTTVRHGVLFALGMSGAAELTALRRPRPRRGTARRRGGGSPTAGRSTTTCRSGAHCPDPGARPGVASAAGGPAAGSGRRGDRRCPRPRSPPRTCPRRGCGWRGAP